MHTCFGQRNRLVSDYGGEHNTDNVRVYPDPQVSTAANSGFETAAVLHNSRGYYGATPSAQLGPAQTSRQLPFRTH
jgi:hypothetical protein